ncbi:MAG TPA: SulP family inorganic anion transporter [Terriglobales bacterium]|nr:SulP family inorganic anion transporter [Terriglobales bacterium]
MNEWTPKLVQSLRDYNPRTFLSDLVAGITVGLVALPLAMAFAIASGVRPVAGLYCAVIAGFLVSALGGSRAQIAGPTGAFVVVVAGIVARYGLEGLYVVTGMAGVFLIVLGATGMGTAVKFIPRPVVVGFTNGIAVIIASTQIKDFLGLRIAEVPGSFAGRMAAIGEHLGTYSASATALSLVSLVILILFARYWKKVPGAIVVLVVGTAAAALLQLHVETIGSRFGGLQGGWPRLHVPAMQWGLIPTLISPALTVALLGAIESLMSAVVADRMTGDRHNPNVELVAQGIANVASPLFLGLPATGAIARTATNIRSGAKTPVAGIVHALTVLAVLLFAAPLARFVPLSVLAAILFMVAYNMGEWGEIPELLKLSKLEITVWLVTFLLTVFADLTVAVEFGMVLAALTFIRKVSLTTTVSRVTDAYVDEGRVHILQDKAIPHYATVYRIHGPFLFGATDKIEDVARHLNDLPPIVILRLRNMTAIDSTGLLALEELADQLHASGREMLLCGAREQPSRMLHQSEFEQHVGRENICSNIQEALDRAQQLYREMVESGAVPSRRQGERAQRA